MSGALSTPPTSAAAEERAHQELAEEFRPLFGRIAAGAREREIAHSHPREEVRALAAAGFGALRVPVEAGGRGVSLESLTRLWVELARADSQLPQILRTHFAFVESIARLGPQWQERWYPRILAGGVFGNASTERSGNVIGDTATKAIRTDDGWRIHGTKYYSTGSLYADWVTVTVTTDEHEGRLFAIVDAADPGVELLDDWNGFGQRLTASGTTHLRDARIIDDALIPRIDGPADGPGYVQLVLLATLTGIARAALDEAIDLIRSRVRVFNTGTGVLTRDEPQVLQLVGELSADAWTAEALVRAAARAFDATAGDDSPEAYAIRELAVERAQTVVPRLAIQTAERIFDALGASATDRSLALDRHRRNARTIATHNPSLFKARIVGDFEVNGTVPVGLWGIGDLEPAARA